jgi:hypothetical protein
MPFTAWKTYSSGDTATAADRNTYERDNGRWLSHASTGGAPMCRVYNSSTLSSFTDGNAVTFDSERYDIGGMHSIVSNTSRITVPSGGGGVYHLGACIRGDIVSPTDAVLQVNLRLNGTTFLASQNMINVDTTNAMFVAVATDYALAAADYVEVTVAWSGGSSCNITAASNRAPEFWARWVGE